MTHPYFGAVGNGETVALIGPDAAVAWLCAPHPDSFPVFARALDPRRGGALTLQFRWGDAVLEQTDAAAQRYLERTNVLGTSLLLDDLAVTVLDYMPRGRRCLVRHIRLTNLGERRRGVSVGFQVAVTRSEAAPEGLAGTVYAAFKGPRDALLSPGETTETVLVLAYGHTPTEAYRNWAEAGTGAVEEEVRFWHGWLAPARQLVSGDTALDEAYCRSLLVLKLLCMEESGAILAAPTATFLPVPGGVDWLREGYVISRCLEAAGLHAESRRFCEFARVRQGAEQGGWPEERQATVAALEEPFHVPATLWLARNQLRAGRREEALELVRRCLESATDLGLMAEHADPAQEGQYGHFPRGLSHAELVLTLLELFGTPAF